MIPLSATAGRRRVVQNRKRPRALVLLTLIRQSQSGGLITERFIRYLTGLSSHLSDSEAEKLRCKELAWRRPLSNWAPHRNTDALKGGTIVDRLDWQLRPWLISNGAA
ncbi:hypothetical protein FB45DRAFT_905028 [Roridomyces roridus]|uniref:Uncharacterized protein n=1 Tax=Roridomyces roridus TaxID=1738132 RepID=A0AAD7C5A9_9AGAR|nr:hypothetical protein FB45DRAFT_905028 [Roridomyces roridus]